MQTIGSPNLVESHRFFVTDMAAPKVAVWLRHHPTSGTRTTDYGTSHAHGRPVEWSVTENFAPVRALFDNRALVFSIAELHGGQSAIRVDAQVTWLPAKPPGDLIGLTGAVTVSLSAGLNPGEGRHPPVTVTDPAKIAPIKHHLNALEVFPSGTRLCPADFGQYLTISFEHEADAAPFATARVDTSGCQIVQIRRLGRIVEPPLWGIDRITHASFAAFVGRLVGIRIGS